MLLLAKASSSSCGLPLAYPTAAAAPIPRQRRRGGRDPNASTRAPAGIAAAVLMCLLLVRVARILAAAGRRHHNQRDWGGVVGKGRGRHRVTAASTQHVYQCVWWSKRGVIVVVGEGQIRLVVLAIEFKSPREIGVLLLGCLTLIVVWGNARSPID